MFTDEDFVAAEIVNSDEPSDPSTHHQTSSSESPSLLVDEIESAPKILQQRLLNDCAHVKRILKLSFVKILIYYIKNLLLSSNLNKILK